MELREYLHILWARKVLILLCLAVSAGSALAISLRTEPTYEATAKIVVGPRAIERGDAVGALQEMTMSQQFVTTYAEILRSRPLAEAVVRETESSISADELTERIATKIIADTRLIEVTATSRLPEEAAEFANKTVSLFVEDEGSRFGGGSPVTASVLQSALEPTVPVSPKPLQSGLMAGLVGLMIGVGIAFIIENLDTTLKTRQDIESVFAPLPAIATIPFAPAHKDGCMFLHTAPNSPESEAIRMLRGNIQFFSVDRPLRRVLITSTVAGEGKTTVAVNLAASIAATNVPVLLIDADLRRPTFKKYFPNMVGPGLSEVLSGRANLGDVINKTNIPNLSIVASGELPPNPSELLGSQRMAELLDLAATLAEVIVLDTAPALSVADATALGPMSDGVVLVVRAGTTNADNALGVVKSFERHGARVLGVALNAVEGNEDSNYYYHYGSAVSQDGSRRARRRVAKVQAQVVGYDRSSRRIAASIGSTQSATRLKSPVGVPRSKSIPIAANEDRGASRRRLNEPPGLGSGATEKRYRFLQQVPPSGVTEDRVVDNHEGVGFDNQGTKRPSPGTGLGPA